MFLVGGAGFGGGGLHVPGGWGWVGGGEGRRIACVCPLTSPHALQLQRPQSLTPPPPPLGGLTPLLQVSHNVPEISKAKAGMPADLDERDWGVQQIVNSANWGDRIGCFLTGGLNLQGRGAPPPPFSRVNSGGLWGAGVRVFGGGGARV